MRAHEVIQKAREQAGMSDTEVAARSGLSIYEYGDVEAYDDEFTTAIPLRAAKAICGALHLNLTELLALEPLAGADLRSAFPADLVGLSRNVVLRKRRESLGLSIPEVADAIGFEDIAIEQAEADCGHLESLPIQVIAGLAVRLKLPLGNLIVEAP
jgi:transcriptional regulator with XRE-family HTH domain